jgi:hypothetical protein
MKNENLYLVAFLALAILLFVMVVKSERERFEPDSVSRISKLETGVSGLDTRLTEVETTLKDQKDQIATAQSSVNDATASLNMIT